MAWPARRKQQASFVWHVMQAIALQTVQNPQFGKKLSTKPRGRPPASPCPYATLPVPHDGGQGWWQECARMMPA